MNYKDVLAKIDAAIGPRVHTFKAKAEADAYVQDQLAKAKKESEDEKDGAEKARKRLDALRTSVATLEKASWDGMSNPITIPVYEFGYEDTTAKAEKSETEVQTPPPGNKGTQADVGFAGGGGATGFGDAKGTGGGGGGQGGLPNIGGTAGDGSSFAAPGGALGYNDAKSIGKAIDDMVAGLGTAPTPVAKSAQPEVYAWPNDLAKPEFLKEGVTKRGETWGTDEAKAPKA